MKFLSRSSSDQWFVAVIGLGFLLVSVLGVIHGAHAGLAQCLYHNAKYGSPPSESGRTLAFCRRAYALYPWNYYFSIEAAERAYEAAGAATASNREDLLRQSQFWCERGLIQNPWRSQLRRMKTRFLWEASPSAAIRFWEEHTDWHFWDPYNHAVLAELQAKAGDFKKAERSLKWTEGTSEYESTRQRVQEEKAGWKEALQDNGEGWGE
jgi:hypothetical protein